VKKNVRSSSLGHFEVHNPVGPLDTPDESAWRTEIGWPILKIAERPD
jgi:hypothetical protein